jgi:hypothetical protein
MHYERLWPNKWLTAEAASVEDMVAGLQAAVEELEVMKADGVIMAEHSDPSGDHIYLLTDNPAVAAKFGFEPVEENEEEDEQDDAVPCVPSSRNQG